MKYKVGNRVRVRKDLEKGKCYDNCLVVSDMAELAGEIVTISQVKEDTKRYSVKEDCIWAWSEEMFEELVTFTKADLRDGDVVTTREGEKDIFHDGHFTKYNIDCYNDDLTDVDSDKEYDIVKVERPIKLETIFEREEEPTELTISEIKEKFGITGLLKIKEDE